jgi:hypothetical protein
LVTTTHQLAKAVLDIDLARNTAVGRACWLSLLRSLLWDWLFIIEQCSWPYDEDKAQSERHGPFWNDPNWRSVADHYRQRPPGVGGYNALTIVLMILLMITMNVAEKSDEQTGKTKKSTIMTIEFRKVSYSSESDDLSYPFWRVDYELDGERRRRDVQARSAADAHRIVCHELGVLYRAL